MAKRKWAWSLVLIIAIVLAVVMLMNGRDQYIAQPMANPTPTPTASKPAAKKPSVSGTAQQTQAYSEVVKQYIGRQIQFDANCQAIPTQTTFKNGTAVLFDNRSGGRYGKFRQVMNT